MFDKTLLYLCLYQHSAISILDKNYATIMLKFANMSQK